MKRCSLFAVCLFLAAGLWASVQVTDLKIQSRWPWNGKVDISYSIECDELDDDGQPAKVYVGFTGYDADLQRDVPMYSLSGDGVDAPVTAGGPYTLVWDAAEDDEDFHSSAFSVKARATVGEGDYIVVDISEGADAETYPWRYSNNGPRLNDDDCRTEELWLRKVKAGTFTMGTPTDELGRNKATDMACHKVTLTEDYFIGVFECTQKQWELVMGSAPAEKGGEERPVENVSYDEVRGGSWPENGHYSPDTAFMGRLQLKTDIVFDLPTEAQWECACRMKADGECQASALTSGENLSGTVTCSNLARLGRYAGNTADEKGGYAEHTVVGNYEGSGISLFDVHGNVAEWCLDWFGASVSSTVAVTDPTGPDSGTARLLRGGSWKGAAASCRAGARAFATPDMKTEGTGFRVAAVPRALMTYGLTVKLVPSGSNRWVLDGVSHASGDTVLLEKGEYTISFTKCEGYATPDDMTIVLDKTKTVEVEYPDEYSLSYSFDIVGATWTVKGVSHAGGETVKLAEGEYEVTFSEASASGATTPAPQKVTLDKNMNITMSYLHPMYLCIDISRGASASRYSYYYSATGPDLSNDACRTTQIWLRLIPNGSFVMGSPSNELGRYNGVDFTQHKVTLTNLFYIGVFEITQKQWQLVMGNAPFKYSGSTRPAECISYEGIRGAFDENEGWPQDGHEVASTSFMGLLKKRTNLVADLPTEAQWEYACRMRIDGSCYTTALNSGENLTDVVECENLNRLGRYSKNQDDEKGGYTEHTIVGSYEPNEIGLYDMHGNVMEWCLDWYVEDTGSRSAVTDPTGPTAAMERVMRGGGWKSYQAQYCRCAYRGREKASENTDVFLGFRLGVFPDAAIEKK